MGEAVCPKLLAELDVVHDAAPLFTKRGLSVSNLAFDDAENTAVSGGPGLELATRVTLGGGASARLSAGE